MLKSYISRLVNGKAKYKANYFDYDHSNAIEVNQRMFVPSINLVRELKAECRTNKKFNDEMLYVLNRFVHKPSAFAGDILFIEVERA